MAKNIEEVFTEKINGYNYHIHARNFNAPLFSIDGEKTHGMTTDQMRQLAEHLTKTADIIEADKDFRNK